MGVTDWNQVPDAGPYPYRIDGKLINVTKNELRGPPEKRIAYIMYYKIFKNTIYTAYTQQQYDTINKSVNSVAQHHHLFQIRFSTWCENHASNDSLLGSIAKESFARSHPVVYPQWFVPWASLFSTKFAALPTIPSAETTKGVKDA